jgi:hypothetical protein
MKQHGIKSFDQLYDDLTKSTFKKYGFINSKILNQWDVIVGESLAKICWPEKITFEPGQTRAGILHINVSNPAFSLEIQSYEARIVERIATFFGYKAVSRVRISVKPKKASEIKQSKQPVETLAPKIKTELPKELEHVRDEELKAALASLYEGL